MKEKKLAQRKLVSFQLIRGKQVHKPSFAHGRGTAALDLLSTTERSKAEQRVLKAAERWWKWTPWDGTGRGVGSTPSERYLGAAVGSLRRARRGRARTSSNGSSNETEKEEAP